MLSEPATKKSKNRKEGKTKEDRPREPPDGGWGWVIVTAYILAGITTIPIIQNFGLIYKDRLEELGLSSTDITFIISLNSSFGQILGVLQGPLLKKFGYRKMAFFAVTCFSLGTFLTGLSHSLPHFIVTYGMITSVGFTFSLTSFSMALNVYFKKNRSRAAGLLMGFQGIGPVVTPFLVNWSLSEYGTQWTAFLLAALNANGYISASLLQPVKWHSRIVKKAVEDKEEKLSYELKEKDTSAEEKDDDDEVELFQADAHSIINVGPPDLTGRRLSTYRYRSISCSEDTPTYQNNKHEEKEYESLVPPLSGKYQSTMYLDGADFAVAKSLTDIAASRACLASMESLGAVDCPEFFVPAISMNGKQIAEEDENAEANSLVEVAATPEKKSSAWWRSLGEVLVKAFDLDLLKDRTYVVIMLGLSIAIIGELIFSLLTPFILAEVGLDRDGTALFMSISAVADIVARFAAPHVGVLIRFNSRKMYISALIALVIARFGLIHANVHIVLMYCVAGCIGGAKGFRTVFWAQVIPDYVPIQKLGSAMSLQNLANGIIIIFAGPLGGKLVEINNSYLNIIYFANTLSLITISLWIGHAYLPLVFRKKNTAVTVIRKK